MYFREELFDKTSDVYRGTHANDRRGKYGDFHSLPSEEAEVDTAQLSTCSLLHSYCCSTMEVFGGQKLTSGGIADAENILSAEAQLRSVRGASLWAARCSVSSSHFFYFTSELCGHLPDGHLAGGLCGQSAMTGLVDAASSRTPNTARLTHQLPNIVR